MSLIFHEQNYYMSTYICISTAMKYSVVFMYYIQQSILLPSLSIIPFYMQVFVYMVSKVM